MGLPLMNRIIGGGFSFGEIQQKGQSDIIEGSKFFCKN